MKPYRCKVPCCVSVPFSSTACLLRHEREAHGMHGHGEKPYQCEFTDCERSFPGNGFPRRWNLQDHMKRVHDYTGPLGSSGSSPPSPSSVSSVSQGKVHMTIRKKRTSHHSQGQHPKRSKSITTTKTQARPINVQPGISRKEYGHSIHVHKQWSEQHTTLRECKDSSEPSDSEGHERIATDYTLLDNIGINLQELDYSQYTPY